ncbi:MAG: DUF3127 domain-containing protein [Bacteroidota bacterium]
MSFEIEGKLHKKYDTESKTASFQAREFVIETEGTYPQFIKFQLTQDRCSIIDGNQEGEMIKVHFDLRGREWNGKYFTNLNAWRVEQASTATVAADPMPNNEDFPTVDDEPPAANYNDDLPF